MKNYAIQGKLRKPNVHQWIKIKNKFDVLCKQSRQITAVNWSTKRSDIILVFSPFKLRTVQGCGRAPSAWINQSVAGAATPAARGRGCAWRAPTGGPWKEWQSKASRAIPMTWAWSLVAAPKTKASSGPSLTALVSNLHPVSSYWNYSIHGAVLGIDSCPFDFCLKRYQ